MDTPFSNIANAIGQNNSNSNSVMDELNRKAENYKILDDLNKEGVSLKNILSQIDDLKQKVEGLEKQQPRTDVDAGVFMAMEAAVKDDPEVIKAKENLSDTKRKIILEICMKDPRYSEAYDCYRSKVSERYVQLHSEEQPKARKKARTQAQEPVDQTPAETE